MKLVSKTQRTNRPRIRSWEADEDVVKLLDLAVLTTSVTLKSIVNEALRLHGPAIIQSLLEESAAPRRDLEKLLAGLLKGSSASGKGKGSSGKSSDSKA